MSEPFLGEIKMFAGNFAPRNYAFCNGQTMAISQNTALFSLLGTYYGGNGIQTFGLPDLQGRAPMFWGNGPGLSQRTIGEIDGGPNVTLTATQIPRHKHQYYGATGGDFGTPVNAAPGNLPGDEAGGGNVFSTIVLPGTSMGAVGVTGKGGQHNNMMPYLVVSFIIALQGIYPPRQ